MKDKFKRMFSKLGSMKYNLSLLVLVNILNILDTAFTYYFTVCFDKFLKIGNGYYKVAEGNPLMDYLLQLDPTLFIITKLSIVFMFTLILYDGLTKLRAQDLPLFGLFSTLMNIIYIIIVVNHLHIMYVINTVELYILD